MNDFLKLAEELDWSYNVDDTPNERGEVCVVLEKYSPQGQDFMVSIWFETDNECDFADKLEEYWRDFDPSEEAINWIGPDGHGINGAPYDLQDIINDMVDCKEMLRDLVVKCHNKAYPGNKIGEYDKGLTLDDNEYHMTGDERRAVYGILSSIDNVLTFASSLPCRCGYDYLRMEIEEMADRFKEQVRNKLEQSFLNR